MFKTGPTLYSQESLQKHREIRMFTRMSVFCAHWSSMSQQKSLRASLSSFYSVGWDSFRFAMIISTETLSLSPLRSAPSWSGFPRIRSVFLTILLYYLPQEVQIIPFSELSRLLLHSISGDRFSDASKFSNSSMSAIRIFLSQIPPAIKAYPGKILGSTVLPNWWSLALISGWNRIIFNQCSKRKYWSFEWLSASPLIRSFLVCQEVFHIFADGNGIS